MAKTGRKFILKKLIYMIKYPWKKFRENSPLASFICGRFFTMIFLLFLIGFSMFALMALAPGDIVDQMMSQQIMAGAGKNAGEQKSASTDNARFQEEQMKALRAELGIDKPFYIQYGKWLKRVIVNHDLGVSLISGAPVTFLIRSRMWNSLLLNIISLVLITTTSFALGVYFSSKAGTRLDVGVTFFALFFNAFPGILLLILLQLFAGVTHLFPVTGYPDFSFGDAPGKFVFSYGYHIFLPLLSAFLGGVGGTMRMIRATMLDQLGLPYIFALRARGISEKRVYFNHAFRNTLNPYISGSANLLASLFGGSLLLEIIFAYPGIGRLTYEAIMQQDINLVLANQMLLSALVLVGMLISDILLAFVDPRIRYGSEK